MATTTDCIPQTNTAPLPTKAEEQAMERISPFELKNKLISLAEEDARKSCAAFLNAGRGNPNWIATEPREAFFLLGKFALSECKLVDFDSTGIAGIPASAGIADRFTRFIAENAGEEGALLLKGYYDYMTAEKGMDPDKLVHEWAEAIIGDQYPTPDRILSFVEPTVNDYLKIALNAGQDTTAQYDLFATEGGTAAMCYCFDSLQENFLLFKGDTIALMTPIFTPYIEIPRLERFSFNVVNITANRVDQEGYHDWQCPDSEIDKLRDPKVKLLCLVNPSNPPSYALSQHTIDRIIDIVKTDNPGLMIITDDVYGTFVDGFRSLMYELPANTLCVYSFSKYFGATGWRLAVTALAKDNIYDQKIAALPAEQKAALAKRYGSITPDADAMKFIDRMVADSRMVALNHTAGLSTPQQMQMALFAAQIILDKNGDYQRRMIEMVHARLAALWQTTGFTLKADPLRAGYYSEIDIMVWAKKFYGDDFASWLGGNYEPVDFVVRLAQKTATVLLNGDGFDGPAWSVRASLANLNAADYLRIGTSIRQILDEYYQEYTWKKYNVSQENKD